MKIEACVHAAPGSKDTRYQKETCPGINPPGGTRAIGGANLGIGLPPFNVRSHLIG